MVLGSPTAGGLCIYPNTSDTGIRPHVSYRDKIHASILYQKPPVLGQHYKDVPGHILQQTFPLSESLIICQLLFLGTHPYLW